MGAISRQRRLTSLDCLGRVVRSGVFLSGPEDAGDAILLRRVSKAVSNRSGPPSPVEYRYRFRALNAEPVA